MTLPVQPVFFIDWCLGKTIATALTKAGAQIEHHGAYFAQDTPDAEWLQAIGDSGWVVLTKDQKIGRNTLELTAIARANVKVFALASGNLSRQQMADTFVSGLKKLEKFASGNQAPFIAKLYKDGRVGLWRNRTQHLKHLLP